MKTWSAGTETAEEVAGLYGPGYSLGILADHLHLLDPATTLVLVSPSGKRLLAGDLGGRAYTVVCGSLITIPTEDGPVDGRCGLPVEPDPDGPGACSGHAEEMLSWRSLSEGEKAAWEYDQEPF